MVTPFILLPHQVSRVRSEVVPDADGLGNDVRQESTTTVSVAGWAVPTSDEPKVAGHDRLEVDLELYAPSGVFHPDDEVVIAPYGRLRVLGWPENYDHGPFGFVPGVEVINLGRADR